MDKAKAKTKRIGNLILNGLLYIFLMICIFSVFVTTLSKKDSDGAAEVFGYQMRVVVSDSMAACEYTDVSDFEIKDIPLRSMVFVKVMPDDPAEADEFYRSFAVGDVLTFRYVYTTQVTITHRITSIVENDEGGFTIKLAGDNKNTEDGQLIQTIETAKPNNMNYVIGKVVGQSYPFGLFMSFLTNPLGIVLVIIVPCAIIILFELIKIMRVLGADKKQRENAEKEKKDNELEELKKRLAELEALKNAQPAQPPQPTAQSTETAQPTETAQSAEAVATENNEDNKEE